MNRDEIVSKLRENAPALKAEGVTGLSIYGSRARGDAREDSDLDVLIEVSDNSDFSFKNLVDIETIIHDATGIQTQVAMRRSLHDRIAKRIADDIIPVF